MEGKDIRQSSRIGRTWQEGMTKCQGEGTVPCVLKEHHLARLPTYSTDIITRPQQWEGRYQWFLTSLWHMQMLTK